MGAVLIYGNDDGTFGVIASPSLASVREEYVTGWSDKDIRAIRARERGYWKSSDTITDRDVITPAETTTNPFYSDLLARHGLRYFACTMVSPDPRIEVGVSVQRAAGKPEYTDEELDVLARLGRHIERSLRLSIRLMDAELGKYGLGDALSRIDLGAFVLDSLGRVIFSNAAADRLVGDGLEIVNNRLSVVGLAIPGTGQNQLVGYGSEKLLTETRPILVQRRHRARPLALYVLPISRQATALGSFLIRAEAVVLVVDPEPGAPADPSVIRDVLGVTLAEARIASLVGSGLALREAAEKLGISEETARTVLKRVFAKVGVSRQNELAALLTKLVLK